MKLARAKGRITLPGTGFKTSRKIPEEVFATGELKIVADLLDGDLANVHLGTVQLGIRHVACIPLRMVRYLDRADMKSRHQEHRRAVSRQPRKGQPAGAAHAHRARYARHRSRRGDRERAALSRNAREGAHRARAEDRRGNPEGAAARRQPQRRVLRVGRHVGAGAVDWRRLLRHAGHARRAVRLPGRRRRRQGPGGGAADVEDPRHLLGVRVGRR